MDAMCSKNFQKFNPSQSLTITLFFPEVCFENLSFAKTYDHDFSAKVLKIG